uniref:CSON001955 protein n=1 Tax=Culicoides sonorensis TaxID=179676 RepID=A0A336KZM3_CULSO
MERSWSQYQIRRLGFPHLSRFCIIKRLPIGDFIIGRSLNAQWNFLNCPSTYVSKNHCTIKCLPNGEIRIKDTSFNGTYINGENYRAMELDLRLNDEIGIGFPVNQENATNGKSYYGFKLELYEIPQVKMEMKTERPDEPDELENLIIDESPSPSTSSEHRSQEIAEEQPGVENVENQIIAETFGPEIIKQESLKTEWTNDEDDDFGGNFTDEEVCDDEVIVLDSSEEENEPFSYLNQLSQEPVPKNVDGYNNTQLLLKDLNEPEIPEVITTGICVVSEKEDLNNTNLEPIATTPVACEPSKCQNSTALPTNIIPINALDTDNLSDTTILNKQKGAEIQLEAPSDTLEQVLKNLISIYGTEMVQKTVKKLTGHSSSKNTHKKSSKNKNDLRKSSSSVLNEDPLSLKEKKSSKSSHKKSTNQKSKDRSKNEPSTSKEKTSDKIEKRRKSVQQNEEQLMEIDEKNDESHQIIKPLRIVIEDCQKAARIKNRRKSMPCNFVINDQNEAFEQSSHKNVPLPKPNIPDTISTSILRRFSVDSRSSSHNEPEVDRNHNKQALKRKAENDTNNHSTFSLKKLKSVPPEKNIEELFRASQLPPPLEVVPEPKEPEFKNILFNKTKHRVAHNKTSDKQKDDPPKKKKDLSLNGEKDINRNIKTSNTFKIPKIPARRKSTVEKPENDLLSILNTIEEPVQTPSCSRQNSNEEISIQSNHEEPSTSSDNNRNESTDMQGPIQSSVEPEINFPDIPRPNFNSDIFPSEHRAPSPPPSPFLNKEKYQKTLHPNSDNHQFAVPALPVPNQLFYRRTDFNGEQSDPRLQNGLFPTVKSAVPPYNVRNILSDVLHWEVERLGDEYPVCVDYTKLHCMTPIFGSCQQYIDILSPLLKLEMFKMLAVAYSKNVNTKMISAEVISKSNNFNKNFNCENLSSICCQCNMINGQEIIRAGTVVILKYNNRMTLGYVDRAYSLQDVLKHEMFILFPDNFSISIVRERNIKIIYLKYLKVELENCLSLADLKRSPAEKLILNPHNIDFDRNLKSTQNQSGLERLNQEQFDVLTVVSEKITRNREKPQIFLIEGPPGTGKSRLICNMIVHMLRTAITPNAGFRILLCAPSNNAVNVLTEKLASYREILKTKNDKSYEVIKLVRFGHQLEPMSHLSSLYSLDALVEKEVVDHFKSTADQIPSNCNEQEERISLKNKITDLENSVQNPTDYHELQKNKRNLLDLKIKLEKLEKKMYFLVKNQKNLDEFKMKARKNKLNLATIVCCTLGSCPSLKNNCSQKFDILIIDEASQATEINCLPAINLGVKHIVMIGDTQQLPGMVQCRKAKDLGLGTSLFTRIREVAISTNHQLMSLRSQYRMHPEILKFPNQQFYGNQIKNSNTIIGQSSDKSYKLKPYLVFELESEQNFTQNPNCYNTDEISFVLDLVNTLNELTPPGKYSIGVVTPYAKQKKLIEDKLRDKSDKNITVFTIDSIQGQERDIIVLSCTRTEGIGFMSSRERLNVALTRARRSLFICGNFMSLEKSNTWSSLINDAKARNLFIETCYIDPNNLKEHLIHNVN